MTSGYKVEFHLAKCLVKHNELDTIMLVRHRKDTMYNINLSCITNVSTVSCHKNKKVGCGIECWHTPT